jgi:cytochrome b6-f complex iron-sulfur subunit
MSEATPLIADPSRRSFCTLGCLSAAAATLATLSAGCGGGGGGTSSTSPGGSGSTGSGLASATANVSGRVITVPVDGSPLTAVGGAALVRTSVGNYLVARTGQDSFTALTATCTHESNTITNFTGSQFACTFHGSLFTTSGSVARGPATRPLTSFPTTFANNAVTFSV